MQFLKILTIINTHALKGQLKVKCLLLEYEKYLKLNQKLFYYDQSKYTYEPLTISNIKKLQKVYLIKFKEFNEINEVIFLKNQNLFLLIDCKDILQINEESNNFLGFKVINQETNEVIGEVMDYFVTKAHGIYVIKTINNEEKMLADVPEFIINLSISNKILYVKVLKN